MFYYLYVQNKFSYKKSKKWGYSHIMWSIIAGVLVSGIKRAGAKDLHEDANYKEWDISVVC